MAAIFTFGANTRTRVNVEDVREGVVVGERNWKYRDNYVAAEMSAGSSRIRLQLDPEAALYLGRQLVNNANKARRAKREAAKG